jgi:hypothetical protein
MRINYNAAFSWCIIAISVPSYAQVADSSFTFLDNGYDSKWQPKSVKIETDALVGSNSLNTKMFSDVLFSDGFTPSSKQKFLDGNQDQAKLYSHLIAKGEYKLDSNYGVYVKYKQMVGFAMNKDFSEMLFFGNSAFKNKRVESKESEFTQATTVALGLTKKGVTKDNWSSKIGVGINFILDLRQAYTDNASLYTETNGDYLDVELHNMSLSKKSSGLKGIGFELDYEYEYILDSKNKLGFRMYDLNFNYLINQKSIYLDTTFRFDGYQYNVFNDSASLAEYVDTTYNNLIERGTKSRSWVSLPSRIYLNWNHNVNTKTVLITEFYAIDLSAYGIGASLGVKRKVSDKLLLFSSLGYGDFTGITWKFASEFKITQSWDIYLNIQGLNALAIPEDSKNYGVSLGVSKHL